MVSARKVAVLIGSDEHVRFWAPILLDAARAALAASDPWISTTTGAELTGRVPETVRQWAVAGKLGRRRWNADDRCWEFRRSGLIDYLVRRFGAEKLPQACGNLGTAKGPKGRILNMAPFELTPMRAAMLRRYLEQAEKVETAAAPSPEDAERKRVLKARQDKLAAEEAATAAKLEKLRNRLDKCTMELSALIRRFPRDSRMFPHGTAHRYLDQLVANIDKNLPDYLAKGGGDPDLATALRLLLLDEFPELENVSDGYDAALAEQLDALERKRALRLIEHKDDEI